jgi:hypothetical protein
MLFSFVYQGCSICPEAVLDYVPRGWVGVSYVVCVAHLLCLQIYAGSFEIGWEGEMACCFSQGRHLKGLGSA